MKLADPLQDLKRKARAELRRLRKEAKQEAKIERRAARKSIRAARKAAWAARWPRWTAWWELRAKEVKTAATIAGGVATIVTVVVSGYRHAAGAWVAHKAKRAWSFYASRDVGPADQPPPSGVPSTAFDFQKTGRPPDGGR